MRIFIVLEDKTELLQVRDDIREMYPDAGIETFDSSLSALSAARSNEVDIAVLSAETPELGGIDLGQYLT